MVWDFDAVELFSNNWWAEELVGLFSDFICQMKVKGVILPLHCR